jgi:hypothetical protein
MCHTLLAWNATQALLWEPIALQLSDKEGRIRDQQGWYRGKRLPSLDGAGVLIHLAGIYHRYLFEDHDRLFWR